MTQPRKRHECSTLELTVTENRNVRECPTLERTWILPSMAKIFIVRAYFQDPMDLKSWDDHVTGILADSAIE